MNNMIDYYPFQVQNKGGYVSFTSKIVYITSNVPLEKWWNLKDIQSFKRRITTIKTFEDKYLENKEAIDNILSD